MNALALALSMWMAAPQAAEVTVQSGEDLAKVAKRALGDERAASELRALNNLRADEVAVGTVLRLPGPDRTRALAAVNAARNALQQAAADGRKFDEAKRQLESAEALLGQARYREAAVAADGAWRLVSTKAEGPTQFTVKVGTDGKTQVASKAGHPVRVEAEGAVEPVYPGEAVAVSKGETPKKVEGGPALADLPAPSLLGPAEGKLELGRAGNGVGPFTLTWSPVAGAAAYEVELVKAGASKGLVLKVDKPEAKVDSLDDGSYQWSVRALARDGSRSERSERRSLQLVPNTLKINVKPTTWK